MTKRAARTKSFSDLLSEAKDYTPGIDRKYYPAEALTDDLSCYRKVAQEKLITRKVLIPASLPKPAMVLAEGLKMITNSFVEKHNRKYDIDDNNREALNQLFAYFTYDKNAFKGDLTKGLLICGGVGSGKSIAMQIFKEWIVLSNLHWAPWNRDFSIAKCSDIALKYSDAEQGGEKLLNRFTGTKQWCFDDLGKDMEGIKTASQHFGNKLNVMGHILEMRYDLFQSRGIKTFATSNYLLEPKNGDRPFRNFYGEYIEDRMKEMFNVIMFYGGSRRK